eukprot:INCI17545.3.p1 GENE.INCI17545.3~~INCI17545.3.p1  ORF type:complete len:424 (+),score=45.08 INCI17545.3:192-1274(+)
MHHHPGSHSFFFAGPRAPPPRAGPWHPHHQHQHQHRHPSQPQQFALGTPSSQQASGPWQPPEFEIFVGKSPHSNMKVVHLPRPGLAVSNLPINPQEEHWKDRFDVSVEGEQLTVNRVDGGTGWRQPLRLRAWVAGSDAAFEPIAQSPRIVARSEGKVRPPQSLHPDHDNAPTRPWTQEPEPDQVLGEGGPLLHSGVYGVPQTWSQEPHGYQRRVHVHVASELSDQPRPVLLLLHGRGGNGRLAVRSAVLQQLPDATSKYIVIGLSGYRNCWNVCGEESKAPDLEFVELVVKQLCTYANVDPTFILYGTSNGSGLLNNVLIQSSDKRIVAAISEVSQLNSQQYRDKSFWKQDSQGAYVVNA